LNEYNVYSANRLIKRLYFIPFADQSMADNKDQKEVTQTQKCFLFLQCFFWIYHLAVVALGFAIFSQVVITYQSGQKVLNSNQYQHSLETIWLWNQGIKSIK
jgi:hypothetical protein